MDAGITFGAVQMQVNCRSKLRSIQFKSSSTTVLLPKSQFQNSVGALPNSDSCSLDVK